jgi:predicted permease
MKWLYILMARLHALLRREQVSQDIEEELRIHIEMETQTNLEHGMSPKEAQAAAQKSFGNRGRVGDLAHDIRGGGWMDSLWQDLRFGVRQVRKSPGFAIASVLTLALGIGANTAIFSLMDAVLLKMLPVKQPDQLVALKKTGGRGLGTHFSYPLYSRLRDENQVFTGVFATSGVSRAKLRVEDDASGQYEYAAKETASGGYFSALGVPALLGRTFTAEDDKAPGGRAVAVISYGFWRRRFAENPSALGKTITVDGILCELIGVTPPEFFGVEVGTAVDVWLPVTQVTTASFLKDRGGWLQIIGRLKPGVMEPQASANNSQIYQRTLDEQAVQISDPDALRKLRAQTIALNPVGAGLSQLRQQFSRPLQILSVTVGLLLLIACANLANLLLARAEGRQNEIAVRLALGASRLRLIRQLLTESLVLAALGAALGLLVAVWGRHWLITFIPSGATPLTLGPALDLRVLGFTTAISLGAVALFALAPALRATRLNINLALKDGAQTVDRRGGRLQLANLLVVAQAALSLLLLIGAGLVVRSLQRIQNEDAGFDRRNVLTFGLELPRGYKEEQVLNLSQQMIARIKTLPGVREASFSFPGPVLGGRFTTVFSVEDYTPKPDEDLEVDCLRVTPGFFETLGMTLRKGRVFTPQDIAGAPKVAVINESMARYFFPQQNPIGKPLGGSRSASPIEIVGIVKDARYRGLREAAPRIVYVPTLQTDNPGVEAFILRTSGDPAGVIAALRREAQAVDRNVSLRGVKTLEDRVDEYLFQERIVARLASFFSLLALSLTCLGLYGVLAYTVGRRTPEIGLRIALGAQPCDVLKLIVKQGMWLILIGVGFGLATALGVMRLLRSFLYDVSPTDPFTFISNTLLLIATALLACYLPARSATKVDPMIALRSQ